MRYRKALCIGINYAGTNHELRGCLNDAYDWADFLRNQHFDVSLLTEKQAVRGSIIADITDLIASLQPQDIGVISYSGHGTWVPDKDGDEPDGRDEAICPYDMKDDGENLIIDDEFGVMFGKIAPGATVVFLTDCCHSGTVFRFMDSPFEDADTAVRHRFLPPSHFIKDPAMFRRMERAYTPNPQGRGLPSNDPLPNLVHISACKDTEYAADAFLDGRYNGAYTYYALKAFERQILAGGTYMDVYRQIRKSLPSRAFTQQPCFNAMSVLKTTRVFA
jgi:hypothetical protein